MLAAASFTIDIWWLLTLSSTVCHNMWLIDIPCRLFEPSSRSASVSIVSLVTHTGISSLMVVVHVVNSFAFSKLGKGCTGTGCSVATKKMSGGRTERTGRQCGQHEGGRWDSARAWRARGGHTGRGGPRHGLGPGRARPGLGLGWVGAGRGREWKTHIKQS